MFIFYGHPNEKVRANKQNSLHWWGITSQFYISRWKGRTGKMTLRYRSWGQTKNLFVVLFSGQTWRVAKLLGYQHAFTEAKYWFITLTGTYCWLILSANYLLPHFHYWDSNACITKGSECVTKSFGYWKTVLHNL